MLSLLFFAGKILKPQHTNSLIQDSDRIDNSLSYVLTDFLGSFIFYEDLASTRDGDSGTTGQSLANYESILAPYES